MTHTFDVVIERDKAGWYVANVPALHGCHTQAKSLDTLMKRVQEVIELCLMEQREDYAIGDFVGVQRVSVAV